MKVTPLARPFPVVPEIHRALREGVEAEAFPGGATAIWSGGKLVHLSSTGDLQTVPERRPMNDLARFDLASLTKVVSTTAAIAVLLARRMLQLDDLVSRYWVPFARGGKRDLTVRHLLNHTSGLPAWKPLFLRAGADPGARPLFDKERPARRRLGHACRRGRAVVLGEVETASLERKPGEAAVYSDLGFIALGHLVEVVSGKPLDRFAFQEVHSELRLDSLAYQPLDQPLPGGPPFVATGVVRPREPAPGQEGLVPAPDPALAPEPRPGEVDDDNAYAMGGVAGHAGLFGSVGDVAAFGNLVLEELSGAMRLGPAEIWRELVRPQGPAGSTRALGFDTPSREGSQAGRHLAASETVGHLGFTGTSLWIDLRRKLSIALLTNRVHPTRANEKIKQFRPGFHDAVVEALGLSSLPGA